MKQKVPALAFAFLVPLLYMLAQWLAALADALVFALLWTRANGPEGLSAALSEHMNAAGLYVLLAGGLLGIGLALLLRRRWGLTAPKAEASRRLSVIAPALLCGLSMNVLCSLLLTVTPFPPSLIEEYERLVRQLTGQNTLLTLLSACVAAPLAEELLFRGLCLPMLRRAFSARAAIVLQAVLFAGFHLNWVQAFGVFPAAIVLGLAYEWSGGLLCPILLHIAFNSANELLALLPADTPPPLAGAIPLAAAVCAALSVRALYKARLSLGAAELSHL